MATNQVATASRIPADECAGVVGSQCQPETLIAVAEFPNGTCFNCNDTGTGTTNIFTPIYVTDHGTPTKWWALVSFENRTAMSASKNWYLIRTQNQAVNRPSIIRVVSDAGGVHKFDITDSAGTVLATGTTAITTGGGTRYICLVAQDDSGANRTLTLYLWNGTSFVSEVTATGGGVVSSATGIGFGKANAKGAAGSGGIFRVGNIYTIDNYGSLENTIPTKPVYLLERNPSANGTYTDFDAGAPSYLDVDDPGQNDGNTTYDESGTGTALKRSTYVLGGAPTAIPANQEIAAWAFRVIWLLASGINGVAGGLIRLSGTDVTFGVSEQPYEARESTPAGGTWGVSDIPELGLQRTAAASDPQNVRLTLAYGYVAYRVAPPGAGQPTMRRWGGVPDMGGGLTGRRSW